MITNTMQFTNDITLEYESTRGSLKPTFPEAYEFLNWIEDLDNRGFHVGTAINLHLYYKDSFLFYFRKDSSTQVTISSKPNVHIKQGTYINNKSFFLLYSDLLKKMNLEKSRGLKVIQKNDSFFTITKSINSPKLFDVLRKAVNLLAQQK